MLFLAVLSSCAVLSLSDDLQGVERLHLEMSFADHCFAYLYNIIYFENNEFQITVFTTVIGYD